MEERERLFAAIELDAAIRQELVGAVQALTQSPGLPDGLRLVAPESWHLTLRFFGSVHKAERGGVEGACAVAASQHSPFELALAGLGAFPSPRRARVLVAGVERGGEEVKALALSLLKQSAPGQPPELEREYTPHLTLGRLRRPRSLEALLAAGSAVRCQALHVSQLVLVRSQLAPTGARYHVVRRFPLRP